MHPLRLSHLTTVWIQRLKPPSRDLSHTVRLCSLVTTLLIQKWSLLLQKVISAFSVEHHGADLTHEDALMRLLWMQMAGLSLQCMKTVKDYGQLILSPETERGYIVRRRR